MFSNVPKMAPEFSARQVGGLREKASQLGSGAAQNFLQSNWLLGLRSQSGLKMAKVFLRAKMQKYDGEQAKLELELPKSDGILPTTE